MTSNLLKNNEKLMTEYNFDKNSNLNLDTLTLGSDKKIWWICKNKHEWEASVGSRYGTGCGCPYCSNKKVLEGYNDLETLKPELLKEWNYKKNIISPSEIGVNSSKKIWWICSNGHEWQAVIYSRLSGTSCPYCNNRKIMKGYNELKSKYPYIAKEWDYNKNGDLTPSDVFGGSNKKIW